MTPTTIEKERGFAPAYINEQGQVIAFKDAPGFVYEKFALRAAKALVKLPERKPIPKKVTPKVDVNLPKLKKVEPNYSSLWASVPPKTQVESSKLSLMGHAKSHLVSKYETPDVMDQSVSLGSIPIKEMPTDIPDQTPAKVTDIALVRALKKPPPKFYPIVLTPYEMGELAAQNGKPKNPFKNPEQRAEWNEGFEGY